MPAVVDRGFSLLEVLVAMAITLLLAGLVLSVIVRSGDVWRRAADAAELSTRAEQILDRIEADLQCVRRGRDSKSWLVVEARDDPGSLRDHFGWSLDFPTNGCMKPGGAQSLDQWADSGGGHPSAARFGMGGSWLRLAVLGPEDRPWAIGYQVQRRTSLSADGPSSCRYFLCRAAVPMHLSTGLDVANEAAADLSKPSAADTLADGVVDFGIWLSRRDSSKSDGTVRVYPRNAVDLTEFAGNGLPGPDYVDRDPDCADVIVRILTVDGAERLSALESGRGRRNSGSGADWWNLVLAHSVVVVRRVEFKSDGS